MVCKQHAQADCAQKQEVTASPPAPAPAPKEQCSCECTCGRRNAAPGLFVDEEFPARWNVLHNPSVAAAWLRPHEIRPEPRLFVEDCSRFAVQQGVLEDSWLIAACAAVAERPELLDKLVPPGQVLFGAGYDGSVRFRLWHLGEWQEVRVDDRLPVDARGCPVYARCSYMDEFWLPLLEKAFAKFHGSYSFLHKSHGNSLTDGLINLTGYSLSSQEVLKWDTDWSFSDLQYASDTGAMILCKTEDSGPGLPGSHAYTVTKVFHQPADKCKCKGEEEMKMVRVRNPWGTQVKWTGTWKDSDERWNKVSNEIKEAMEYKPDAHDDGEFWMDIKDFCANFQEVCIAMENPFEAMKMKMVGQITGKWSDDENIGGLPDDIQKFAKNPQFLLVALNGYDAVEEEKKRKEKQKHKKKGGGSDEVEEEPEEPFNPLAGMETLVELLQEHNRKKRSYKHKISLFIFETSSERRLTPDQLLNITYAAGSTDIVEDTVVRCGVRLYPGRRYVAIPATDAPGNEGEFLLRVFSRHARVRLTPLPD